MKKILVILVIFFSKLEANTTSIKNFLNNQSIPVTLNVVWGDPQTPQTTGAGNGIQTLSLLKSDSINNGVTWINGAAVGNCNNNIAATNECYGNYISDNGSYLNLSTINISRSLTGKSLVFFKALRSDADPAHDGLINNYQCSSEYPACVKLDPNTFMPTTALIVNGLFSIFNASNSVQNLQYGTKWGAGSFYPTAGNYMITKTLEPFSKDNPRDNLPVCQLGGPGEPSCSWVGVAQFGNLNTQVNYINNIGVSRSKSGKNLMFVSSPAAKFQCFNNNCVTLDNFKRKSN